MPSQADAFEHDLNQFKEFVDTDGRHYYIIQFEDGSGRVLRKHPSDDEKSISEFVIRNRFAKEAMRNIAEATDFDVEEDSNTQQNLRSLMDDT